MLGQKPQQEAHDVVDPVGVLGGRFLDAGLVFRFGHDLPFQQGDLLHGNIAFVAQDHPGFRDQALQPVLITEYIFQVHSFVPPHILRFQYTRWRRDCH